MADRESDDGDPNGAMTVVTDGPYGTLSSCLIALPAVGMPVMKFADGRPGEAPFEQIPLQAPRVVMRIAEQSAGTSRARRKIVMARGGARAAGQWISHAEQRAIATNGA